MATLRDPSQSTERPDDVDADSAFVDLLQNDNEVCDNCFSRTHDFAERERWSGVHGWMHETSMVPRPHRVLSMPKRRVTGGTSNRCECGHVDGTKQRPLPNELVEQYTENIIASLREKGIRFNADRLRDVVEHQQSKSDTQGREDSHVFQPAVAQAIRAVDRRRAYTPETNVDVRVGDKHDP